MKTIVINTADMSGAEMYASVMDVLFEKGRARLRIPFVDDITQFGGRKSTYEQPTKIVVGMEAHHDLLRFAHEHRGGCLTVDYVDGQGARTTFHADREYVTEPDRDTPNSEIHIHGETR